MSILVIGSIALDSVETPFGKVEEALGGSAVYFSCAARHFTQVSLLGVVGEDFPEEHVAFLQERGVNTDLLQKVPGKTFRWSGAYEGAMNVAETRSVDLNVFGEFRPELPDGGGDHQILFLANGHPELQAYVARQATNIPLIVLDTMNHWIENERDALLDALGCVQGLILNDAEAISLAGTHNLIVAAERILEMGPRFVVIKKGEHGAILMQGDDLFLLPAYPTKDVKDPTGAGDSFAGGMFGFLAECNPEYVDFPAMRTAMVYGTVTASFTVEDFSLERLGAIRRDQITERLGYIQDVTQF